MRFVPTRVHGMLDYLTGALLIASPWLFGFADNTAAQWVPVSLGVGAIAYSLLTDYELGAVRFVPMCDDVQEQVRWLLEAWRAAQALRAEGADVRAVTAWALFGLVDWNSMLRERRGHYEPGAYDVRHDPPRPTLLAEAATALARDGAFAHPALDRPGWWRREDRVHPVLRQAG